jgi:hypothetical protein
VLRQQEPTTADELPLLLTGVRIVLVSPKTPGNIGSVLRVAENFEVGCSRGCLSARLPACPTACLHSCLARNGGAPATPPLCH